MTRLLRFFWKFHSFISPLFYFLGKYWPNWSFRSQKKTLLECHELLDALGYSFSRYNPTTQISEKETDVLMSIIIPVFNAEKYLKKCLDSIVSQTFKGKYEVILINDGSTDKSGKIIDEYVSLYPTVFKVFNQENKGISAARNRGIEESSGLYVGFIDNDDYIYPSYLERIAKKIDATGADIIQTGFREETEDGLLLSVDNRKDAEYNELSISDLSNLSGFVWGGVFKKTMFKDVEFPVGFWYEDMITSLLLFKLAKRIVILGDSLYVKIIHNRNASKILWSNGNIKSVDQYWLARELVDFGVSQLRFETDDVLCHCLLYEYGRGLYNRTWRLSYKVRNVLFECAAIHFTSFKWPPVREKYYADLYDSFKNRNSVKWRLISLAWILK